MSELPFLVRIVCGLTVVVHLEWVLLAVSSIMVITRVFVCLSYLYYVGRLKCVAAFLGNFLEELSLLAEKSFVPQVFSNLVLLLIIY